MKTTPAQWAQWRELYKLPGADAVASVDPAHLRILSLIDDLEAAVAVVRGLGREIEGIGWHAYGCTGAEAWMHFQKREPCDPQCAAARAVLAPKKEERKEGGGNT